VERENDLSDWVEGEINQLRRVRDELNVQSHLARTELRDAWQKLEDGFAQLESRAKHVASVAEPSLKQFETDVRKLVDDLREGYRRIRDAI